MKASALILPLTVTALPRLGACRGGDEEEGANRSTTAQDTRQANRKECFAGRPGDASRSVTRIDLRRENAEPRSRISSRRVDV
jgi:hypothetical protein